MTTYLLDANVLIAATVAEHEHHDRAAEWLATTTAFALCPIVEGAVLRFLLRIGESVATARAVLAATRAHPHAVFWPDAVSYLDVDLAEVRGHRQVTDAYLVGLAAAYDGLLATFDAALAAAHADRTLLVPGSGTVRG